MADHLKEVYLFMSLGLLIYICVSVFMLFRRFCNALWNTEENEIRKDLVFS